MAAADEALARPAVELAIRIRRYDSRNLVIEQQKEALRGPRWVVAGYHGGVWSLASHLVDLLTDIPAAAPGR